MSQANAHTLTFADAQEVLLSSSFDKRLGIWDGASEGSGSFEAVARGRDGLLSGYENGNDHGYGGGREDERGLSPPSSPSSESLLRFLPVFIEAIKYRNHVYLPTTTSC